MHTFQETAGAVGGAALVIVATIIFMTLFFKAVSWLSREGAKPETLAVRGVIGKNVLVTVNTVGGQSFDRVRFVGFTRSEDIKAHMPYELNGMVILEDEERQRYMVRARDIKMIIVPPNTV
jgi:hypothetical protein